MAHSQPIQTYGLAHTIETYGHTIAGRRRRRHAWPILLFVLVPPVYPLLSTHFADAASLVAWINASIIQGSGIGPPSYVVEASDPHPRHNQNAMTKFADDTYLLVGSNCITTVADEIANMKDWAARNNMRVHPTKMKKLVICRTRFRLPPTTPCPFVEGAERVDSLRVRGVQLDSRLSMGDHITKILNTCSSSTYALRVLRSHGLQPNELHLFARATTIASILYASPAWYGFANEGDGKRLERLISRMRRCGYLPRHFPCIAALVGEADRKLFRSTSHNPTHVLRHHFIDKPESGHTPRTREHNFVSRSTYATLKTHRSELP